MQANLFEFPITDFEEVYTVIDDKKKRIHISSVNYHFTITLDLTKDLELQLEQQIKYGEINFNQKVRKISHKIIETLFKECTCCNKKIHEGYINKQNDSIYCSKECLFKNMTEKEFEKLCDAWVCYWTKF